MFFNYFDLRFSEKCIFAPLKTEKYEDSHRNYRLRQHRKGR